MTKQKIKPFDELTIQDNFFRTSPREKMEEKNTIAIKDNI